MANILKSLGNKITTAATDTLVLDAVPSGKVAIFTSLRAVNMLEHESIKYSIWIKRANDDIHPLQGNEGIAVCDLPEGATDQHMSGSQEFLQAGDRIYARCDKDNGLAIVGSYIERG
jgi:hypothetical protein